MTVELCKKSTCIPYAQGVLGIILVLLGLIKNSLNDEMRHQTRQEFQNTEEYLTNHIVEMPLEECCSICMDESNQELSVGLECGHLFHFKCLKDWVKLKGSCPMCRRMLFN